MEIASHRSDTDAPVEPVTTTGRDESAWSNAQDTLRCWQVRSADVRAATNRLSDQPIVRVGSREPLVQLTTKRAGGRGNIVTMRAGRDPSSMSRCGGRPTIEATRR